MEDSSIIMCRKCSNLHGFQEHMLPVINFGNRKSPIFLISLNPSHREYIQKGGANAPLFSPFTKIDNCDRTTLSNYEIQQAITRQQSYFQTGEHLDWFDDAEQFLNMVTTNLWGKLSFGIQGEANVNHIDIVKCATKPRWTDVNDNDKKKYVESCYDFLYPQIFNGNAKVLMINGSGAYKIFKKQFGDYLEPISKAEKVNLSAGKTCKVYKGKFNIPKTKESILFTGTSRRISSDHYGGFGEIEDRLKIAKVLENFINNNCSV